MLPIFLTFACILLIEFPKTGMPVVCEIRDSILLLTLIGEYTFAEPMRAITDAMADVRFRPGSPLLIDARLSKTSRSSEEFRERATWMASLREKGLGSRCAIVVNAEPHQFGMARMAGTHLDLQGMEVEIFTELQHAFGWLAEVRSDRLGGELTGATGQ